jgi:hypothetical protein
LNRNVGRFLWDGLLRGDALLVIATPERRESMSSHLDRLGADVSLIRSRRQFALLDAQETLGAFMVNGLPDWNRFQATIAQALERLYSRAEDGGICAYGEMVGVLWQAGEYDAAILLEEFWNRLLHESGITLFCGYPIDVFANEFQAERLQAVRHAHTHTICAGADDHLHCAIQQGIKDVLGAEAEEIRARMGSDAPDGEGSILWLWRNLPQAAEGILASARQHYAQAKPAA